MPTTWDNVKSLIYLVALFGIILALLVGYCLNRHGM